MKNKIEELENILKIKKECDKSIEFYEKILKELLKEKQEDLWIRKKLNLLQSR